LGENVSLFNWFRLRQLVVQRLLPLIAITLVGVSATPAAAGKIMFGTGEHVQRIIDTSIIGPNGEKLFLGFKYSHHAFIAPYRTTDDGYVLGGAANSNSYFKLSPERIAELQGRGLLPAPLPRYEIGLFDWLLGHLLWFVLACVAVGGIFSQRQAKIAAKQAEAAQPFIALAVAREAEQDLAGALAAIDQAINLAPGMLNIHMARGALQMRLREWGGCIASYSTVIQVDPKNATALVRRGIAFVENGQSAPAISDYSRALKLAKKNPEILFLRAKAYALRDDHKRAIADCTAALEQATLETDKASIQELRAQSYVAIGKPDRAAADYSAARHIAASLKEQATNADEARRSVPESAMSARTSSTRSAPEAPRRARAPMALRPTQAA
jgi:tetratricopeptide (TPR) repeat protein